MLDFLGLDLLTISLPIRFLPLLYADIMWLWFESSLLIELHFALFVRMCSLIFQKSNAIYKFQCRCNGRTSQRLEVRVKKHVPRDTRNHSTSGHSKLLYSAICEHWNALNSCVVNCRDECFVVLHKTRTKQYLIVLEAIYILFNRPSLCKQNSNTLLTF